MVNGHRLVQTELPDWWNQANQRGSGLHSLNKLIQFYFTITDLGIAENFLFCQSQTKCDNVTRVQEQIATITEKQPVDISRLYFIAQREACAARSQIHRDPAGSGKEKTDHRRSTYQRRPPAAVSPPSACRRTRLIGCGFFYINHQSAST